MFFFFFYLRYNFIFYASIKKGVGSYCSEFYPFDWINDIFILDYFQPKWQIEKKYVGVHL